MTVRANGNHKINLLEFGTVHTQKHQCDEPHHKNTATNSHDENKKQNKT